MLLLPHFATSLSPFCHIVPHRAFFCHFFYSIQPRNRLQFGTRSQKKTSKKNDIRRVGPTIRQKKCTQHLMYNIHPTTPSTHTALKHKSALDNCPPNYHYIWRPLTTQMLRMRIASCGGGRGDGRVGGGRRRLSAISE